MLENYTVTLKTCGPVHIGCGETIQKSEYVYNARSRKVIVLDPVKLFEGLRQKRLLEAYQNFVMNEGRKGMFAFFSQNRISESEYKKWARYTFTLEEGGVSDESMRSAHNIAAFVKDAYGCPYIPGSSLKGAIRSAYANTYVYVKRKELGEQRRKVEQPTFGSRHGEGGSQTKKAERELEDKIFRTLNREGVQKKEDILNDRYAGLRVSDSRPLDGNSCLMLCQKTDVLPDGQVNSISILRECLRPGTEIIFDLELDPEIFGAPVEKIDKWLGNAYTIDKKYFLLEKCFSGLKNVRVPEGFAPVFLGGGVGFVQRTAVYPLYDEKIEAERLKGVKTVSTIITNNIGEKTASMHHHADDVKYKLSPHTRKVAYVNGRELPMGLCFLKITPKG